MKQFMEKKGLLILIGVAILLAGLSVQVGLYHRIKSINAVITGERIDFRDFYETLSAPYKFLMVAGFFALPMGIGLTIAGLVMPGSKN